MSDVKKLITAEDIVRLNLLRWWEERDEDDADYPPWQYVSVDLKPQDLFDGQFVVKDGTPRIEEFSSTRKEALTELASVIGGYSAYLFDMQSALETIAASMPDNDPT